MLEPDVLFLDEPFSALDIITKETLIDDLSKILQMTQTTMLLVSHDFRDIKRLTERAIVLINGSIEAEGTPMSLLINPQSRYVEGFLSYWKENTASVSTI